MLKSLFYVLSIVILIGGQNTIISQNQDSVQAFNYFKLFQKFEFSDTALAKKYVDSSLYFAQKSNNNYLIGRAYQYLGWYFQDISQYKNALKSYENSLVHFEKSGHRQGVADAHGNIGNAHLDMNEYQKSLEHQLMSLDINEEIFATSPSGVDLEQNILGRTYALHNIGAIYGEIGMFEKGLEYARKSLLYEIESDNQIGIAISCNSMAKSYYDLKNIDSSIYYYKKAINLYETKDLDYPYGYASCLYSYSTMDSSDLSNKEKQEMFLKSLQIRRDIGDVDGELRMLLTAAENGSDSLKIDSLQAIMNSINSIIEEYGIGSVEENYQKIKAIYNAKIERYDSAYFALYKYLSLRDEAEEKLHSHNLIAGDIKHQLEKKNLNDSLRIENEFALERIEQKQEINKIKNIIYLIIIGVIILTGSLFFIIQSNRKRKKLNDILLDKNVLIEEKNREIVDSISYAKRLQTAILPNKEEVNKVLPESFLIFMPKDIVSGDFYWFENIDNINLLAVADCTGHGVPGAMMSVVCSNALSRSVNEFGLRIPGEILNKTREIVVETLKKGGEDVADGMDIALIAIDNAKRKIQFSGANNSLWIIRKDVSLQSENVDFIITENGCSLFEIRGDKQPIGLYDRFLDFTTVEQVLCKGDQLYMTSDGFPDQFGGERNKKYKHNTLKRELLSISTRAMNDQKAHLLDVFNTWKGDLEQTDDVCLIGVLLD